MKECFASGYTDMLITYRSDSDDLAGVYRCKIGTMIGELQLVTLGPSAYLAGVSAYEFRTLEPSNAGELVPVKVIVH